MKVAKILFLAFCFLMLSGWVYSEYFSKSSHLFEKMDKIKPGMKREQVVKILSEPDTTYWEPNNDSVWVMSYSMGVGAPDAMRVVLKHGTVRGVSYDQ